MSPTTDEPRHQPARRRTSWWHSLDRKLPLVMTTVLAVMLAASLALTWVTLRESAIDRVSDQMRSAAARLAMLGERSTTQLRNRLGVAARGAEIEAALLDAAVADSAGAREPASIAAAGEAMARLLGPSDTGLTIELWTADGRRIAHAGTDRLSMQVAPPDDAERRRPDAQQEWPAGFATSDSVRFGPLHLADGAAYFWIVAPVMDDGRSLGHVARQYRMRDGQQAEQTIRGLMGREVAAHYRSESGDAWVSLSGAPVSVPAVVDSAGGSLVLNRPGVGEMLAVEEPIEGSPLVIVLELPMDAVLAGTLETTGRLALLSLVLLAMGAAVAWRISRRITRPLAELTGASVALARGDYAARVQPSGDEELIVLGTSFNRMAAEIGAAHQELELQTEEAQTAAEELEQTNDELGRAVAGIEEREAQFRALADAIPQLAWMAEADGSIFWYNRRWHEYTGTTAEEMTGWGWRTVHDPAILPSVMERWTESIASGTPFEMEFPLRGEDGRYRWFLTRVQPLRDRMGRVIRWFGTNTDIDALREAREAAESARVEAERARVEAEAASRAKSDFLAVMSHELRTPLNAIGGYTELMEMGLRGPVTAEQRRDLTRIRESQKHLLGLISAVLDLSRIEAGRVTYHIVPVALDVFLNGVAALVEPQATSRKVLLQCSACDSQLTVLADHEKLRQILLNLLSNAIRHTPANGRVTLTATGVDETVTITVEDTGEGIAEDALERIFEPFVQLDRSLTRPQEGIGLGLSISRDLARGMSGDLTARSRPGEGAAFILVLPRAAGAPLPGPRQFTGEFRAVEDERAR